MVKRKIAPKFKNIKCVYDGHKFDSLLERDAYVWLKTNGYEFSMQDSFDIGEVIGVRCKYRADFVVRKGKENIIIDMKSKPTVTSMFLMKKKMMKHVLKKDVYIVYSVQELAKLLR